MAKYRITAPDGGTYEVTAPDDATEDQVLAYAQQNYQQPSADFSRVTGSVDQPQQPGLIGREARGVGLSARSALQGAGSLVGAIGGDAFNKLLPGAQPSYRDAAGTLADRIGLPKPQNARERVLGDVGEALTGTAATMGVGSALGPTSRLGQLLTAQPRLQAASTATGAGAAGLTREQGGGQGAQLAAGLVGGLSPGIAGMASGAATRGVVRGQSGGAIQNTVDDFSAMGATPTVGQATGRRSLQGLENLLGKAPTSTGVVSRFAERQAEDIGTGLRGMAESLSALPSAERAGRAIERGIDTFSGNVNATKRALYWQADQFIPEATPVPLSNTWRAVERLTAPVRGAEATTGALVQPRMVQLRDNIARDVASGGGQIPYSALKKIRTDIGEAISGASPLNPPSDLRELRQLYGALSRDMESAAKAQGPQAEAAARRANTYTRTAADRLEQVQRVVDKNGGPEKVFNAATSGTREGATTLRAVMQSLPKDGQRAVTAAVIRRMGLAKPGRQDAGGEVFSSETFMTNWSNVSDEAKRALFDRHGPDFSRDMDRIARVASNIKEGSKVLANPSGSAHAGAAYTYGAALVASLFTGGTTALAGSGVAAYGLAHLLTSPKAVKWLARTTSLPRGAIPAAINSMRVAGERDGDDELLGLAGILEQRVQEVPDPAEDYGR